ncbi:SGNH/GDSL hydrolase family protein [Cronobacter dublinensis]
MTVASTDGYIEYTGDGTTKTFAVPFYFILNSDLAVIISDAQGNATTLQYGVDFSAVGGGDENGGSVTLNNAYDSTKTIFIYRNPPATQETVYYENGKFPAKSNEQALDKLTMLIQNYGWFLDQLSLKKPSIFSNYYDAKNQIIRNLTSPSQRSDSANKGYVDDLNAFLLQSVNSVIDTITNGLYGYNTKESFETGNTLNYRNDVLLWKSNGEYYRWDGTLPKVVPAGSTPATTGGIAPGAWRSIGDATLRASLAASGGAGLVGTLAGETVQDALTRLNPGVDRALTALYRNQIMASKSEMGGQLSALRGDLSNPLTQFTGIVLAGDSITWGLSATGIATDSPRSHQLTDARNNSTSNTWANLFHKYIGKRFHHNPTYTQAGWSGSPSGVCVFTYVSQVLTYPAYTPVTLSGTWSDNLRTGAILNRTIDSTVVGSYFSFTFTGFNFDVVFSSTPDSGTIVVSVDGVNVKTINTNSSATGGTSFQVRSTVTLSGFKRNANVKITFTSGSYARIEAIAVNKTTRVTNQGLIGVNSSEYNSILPSAISAGDIYCFVQLGTNDRASDTGDARSPNAVRRNTTGFINYLRANGVNPIMCCANQIDLGQITMPSYFQMSEVSSAIRQACSDGLADFIDHMPVTTIARDYLPFTVSDGLHPNDTGHYLMYMNLVSALENASEQTASRSVMISKSVTAPAGASTQTARLPFLSANSGIISLEVRVNGGMWTTTYGDQVNGAKSPDGNVSLTVKRAFIDTTNDNVLISIQNAGASSVTANIDFRLKETVYTV